MAKSENSTAKINKQSPTLTIITAIIAAILLVIATAAFWVNNSLFDTSNFSKTATASITSDSSRQAIGQLITDKALEDKPSIKNVVQEPAVKIISSALDTDRFKNLLGKVTSKLQTLLTSPRPKPVVLNLQGAKDFLSRLLDAVDQENNIKASPAKIPDQIVLLDTNKLPNFYQAGVVVLWVGPLALIAALILLAVPYVRQRRNALKRNVVIQGAALIVAGLLALLIQPLVRPLVLSSIEDTNARTVVNNLYDAFMAQFNDKVWILIVVGIVAVVVVGAISLSGRFRLRQKLAR